MPYNLYWRMVYQLNLEDNEMRRRVILVYLFSTIGCGFLLIFGCSALINNRLLIATVTLTAATITLINFILFFVTSNYARASHGVSLIIAAVSLFLVLNGGVENTGLLWTYTAIPLTLFLHGHKRGLIILLVFLAIAVLIMYLPADLFIHNQFPDALKTRYIASYLALLLMSWVYEYTSNQTYKRWKKLSALFSEQACTDVLTGISNRRDIMEKIIYENLRAKRRQEQYTLLLIDIDYFKKINYEHGHDIGDKTLIAVVDAINNSLFQRDLFGRWGGEEFLVILPDTNNENAVQAAEKIRASVSEIVIEQDNKKISVTISIGLATSDASYTPDYYIKIADSCLYNAKAKGRNRVASIFGS